jgi:methyl-accepting chemotaxis protein
MADISTAAREQSDSIEQINQVVEHIDESTQQNAALVEEASAAARSMEEQSTQLLQTVAAFRVGATGGVARAAAANAAHPTLRLV